MSKSVITYIRYDISNIENKSSKVYIEFYHLDRDEVDRDKIPQVDKKAIRQHITTSTINHDRQYYEWDALGLKLTSLNENSALLIIIRNKKQIIDHYYIDNALSELDDNPNLVYNTDGYYLYEMNERITHINDTRTPANIICSACGQEDVRANTEAQHYRDIYDKLLERELTEYIDEKIKSGIKLDAKQVVSLYRQAYKFITSNQRLTSNYQKSVLDEFFKKYLYHTPITEQLYANPDSAIDIINDIVHAVRCLRKLDSKLSLHYTI